MLQPRLEPLEDRRMLAAFVVNTLLDNPSGLSSDTDGFISLREAITAANTNLPFGDAPAGDAGLDTIGFASSLFASGPATITLGGTELTITDDLTINGPGAAQLTIHTSTRALS